MTLSGCIANAGHSRPLGELNVFLTADGSFSLHSEYFDEAFHNSAGALNEACAKFAQPAELTRFSGGQTLRILDVCMGLGYNTAAVLDAMPTPAPNVLWWGLEIDRRPLELALAQTGFCSAWSASVHQKLILIRDCDGWDQPESRGTMLWGDARQTLHQLPQDQQFDLILHDAFSPGRCPQLWSEEFLHGLAIRLAPGGRLLTYSRAAAIRASLQRAGLKLFSLLQVPGERGGWSSGTMGMKQFKISFGEKGPGWRSLTAMEHEHLHTRAAVPYRDPTGEDQAEVIRRRRSTEQQLCGLEATNTWHHRWTANQRQG